MEKSGSCREWSKQIQDWRQKLGAVGALADLRPWTSLPERRYKGLSCTDRALASLDCVCMEVLGGAASAERAMRRPDRVEIVEGALRDTFVDLSQNPARRAFSHAGGVCRCLHTGSIVYSFRRDGIILPIEKMFLQGHPRDLQIPPCMTVKELDDLAAMGISLPCLASILLALSLSGRL